MLGFKGVTHSTSNYHKPPGYLEILNGETPPRGPAPTLLYTIFDGKSIPFLYVLLTNDTPFTYQV